MFSINWNCQRSPGKMEGHRRADMKTCSGQQTVTMELDFSYRPCEASAYPRWPLRPFREYFLLLLSSFCGDRLCASNFRPLKRCKATGRSPIGEVFGTPLRVSRADQRCITTPRFSLIIPSLGAFPWKEKMNTTMIDKSYVSIVPWGSHAVCCLLYG